MKEAMNRRMKRRLNVMVPIALGLVLIWVLYNLGKTVSDPFYREYANAQQLSEDAIPADRGTIYDTNGEVLAESYTVWTVQLSPVTIDAEDKEMVAQFLAETLELDYNTVLAQCQQTNRYAVVKKQVEKPEADAIREFAQENGITAIALIEDTKRYYPNNDLASHVIGYVGSDNQGLGGIELEYEESDEDIPEIPCDVSRMRQVFLNILDNAAKHGGEGKKITASIHHEGGQVVVRIRDFGPGIPEDELPHVKMKFYKGSSKARGNGIGLAVCEEIVTMHGGSLTLENAPGGGTLVTISLPSGEE